MNTTDQSPEKRGITNNPRKGAGGLAPCVERGKPCTLRRELEALHSASSAGNLAPYVRRGKPCTLRRAQEDTHSANSTRGKACSHRQARKCVSRCYPTAIIPRPNIREGWVSNLPEPIAPRVELLFLCYSLPEKLSFSRFPRQRATRNVQCLGLVRKSRLTAQNF